FGLPEDALLADLPDEAVRLVFEGGLLDTGWRLGPDKKKQIKRYEGLCAEAERKLRGAKSEAVRRRLARVMSERPCRECGGRRLKPEILSVRIAGSQGLWLGIQDFCALPVEEALHWLDGVEIAGDRADVCARLVDGISRRLGFLREVGLGYLGLDRSS